MPRVVHFEIHADDPERAIRFYTDLFGWSFEKFGEMDYWLAITGTPNEPGIDGALMRRMGGSGDRIIAFVCTIDVPDIDRYIDKARELNAEEALPKNEVPGIGWTAYFKDTEGNVFGIFQAMQQ
jgi:predicted enzyme related to lactoylglutathione lyase